MDLSPLPPPPLLPPLPCRMEIAKAWNQLRFLKGSLMDKAGAENHFAPSSVI